MTTPVPRILAVAAQHPMRLVVTFDATPERRQSINLAGWVRRGGASFAGLSEPGTFARAAIGAYGGNITWDGDGDEGELAIDSVHLEALASEQTPFTGADARRWQHALGFSDEDAADILGLDRATWDGMKAAPGALPDAIARLCRAALRDPFIAEAHLAGPRRDAA